MCCSVGEVRGGGWSDVMEWKSVGQGEGTCVGKVREETGGVGKCWGDV